MISLRVTLLVILTIIIINLSGCAYLQAIANAFGTTSSETSGTDVGNNKLHVGHETTGVATSDYEDVGEVTHGTDYEDVGSVHHSYLKQNGEYVVKALAVLGLLALVGFIVFRFFRFLRKITALHHQKHM